MLSRKSFVSALEAIQENERIIRDAEKVLSPLCVLSASLDFSKLYHEALMRILVETMQDKSEWISWWLYEDVEKTISWKENGEEISRDVTTADALYDFLVNEIEEKAKIKQNNKEAERKDDIQDQ